MIIRQYYLFFVLIHSDTRANNFIHEFHIDLIKDLHYSPWPNHKSGNKTLQPYNFIQASLFKNRVSL